MSKRKQKEIGRRRNEQGRSVKEKRRGNKDEAVKRKDTELKSNDEAVSNKDKGVRSIDSDEFGRDTYGLANKLVMKNTATKESFKKGLLRNTIERSLMKINS